jgi:hypothetical protein
MALTEMPRRQPTDREILLQFLVAQPLRQCSRLTKPCCCIICGRTIQPREMYRDGGQRKRAHDTCVSKERNDSII